MSDELNYEAGLWETADGTPCIRRRNNHSTSNAHADASERMADILQEYINALDASAEIPGVIAMNMSGYFNDRFRAALQAYKETKK